MLYNKKILSVLILLLVIAACGPTIELASSWANKTAKVKKSPKIMVMAFGKDLTNRQAAENYIVAEMLKGGNNAIASLDVFKPEVQHYDSLTMVKLLRANNIDMLLTNAVIDVKQTEHYVPGTTETVPVGSIPVETHPYYNSYWNYYDNRTVYYQTTYETRTTPGYTYTETEVLIESNLYDVQTAELLWIGQSKSYTNEPSNDLFHKFAKIVVQDITKNNFLQKQAN